MHRFIVFCAICLTAYAYLPGWLDANASEAATTPPAERLVPLNGQEILTFQGAATPTPLSASPASPGTPGTPTPVRDVTALQQLLQRLVGYSYPGAPSQEAQIYVGKLPEKMPVDIPLPEGSQVVGTVVRGEESIQIVLDTNNPPDRVLEFFRQQLSAAGWSTQDQSVGPSGGFVPSGISNEIILCKSIKGPSLFLSATSEKGAPTDVRLNLNTSKTQQYPCSQPRGAQSLAQSLMPRLVAPSGAQQNESGSGGSSTGSAYNNATILTDQKASELASFYGDQLAKAGWTKQDSGQSGPIAWSTWTLRDKDGANWKGLFFALDLPGTPSRRFVYLRIDMG